MANYKFVTNLFLLCLFSSSAYAYDAQSMGRGGTLLFDSSNLTRAMYSPSQLARSNFLFETDINATLSDSLVKLSKEPSQIQDGTYNDRISPYYGQNNIGNANAGVTLGYGGFTYIPFVGIADAKALIQNPVYPNATAELYTSKGSAYAYGWSNKKIDVGVSYFSLQTKQQVSTANVLDYSEGVVNDVGNNFSYIANYSLGYHVTDSLQMVSNYQHNTIGYSPEDRIMLGLKQKIDQFSLYFESQDIQSFSLNNSLHLGASYQFSIFEADVGLNQLYPTAGFGINTNYFKLFYSRSGANQFDYYRSAYDSSSITLTFGVNL